jgi:hypothetical protein
MFVLKSRTETDAPKQDSVIFVLYIPDKLQQELRPALCAIVRDFSAATMQLNPGRIENKQAWFRNSSAA